MATIVVHHAGHWLDSLLHGWSGRSRWRSRRSKNLAQAPWKSEPTERPTGDWSRNYGELWLMVASYMILYCDIGQYLAQNSEQWLINNDSKLWFTMSKWRIRMVTITIGQ